MERCIDKVHDLFSGVGARREAYIKESSGGLSLAGLRLGAALARLEKSGTPNHLNKANSLKLGTTNE